jgi:Mg/Co/Ni transporter MgtE
LPASVSGVIIGTITPPRGFAIFALTKILHVLF